MRAQVDFHVCKLELMADSSRPLQHFEPEALRKMSGNDCMNPITVCDVLSQYIT